VLNSPHSDDAWLQHFELLVRSLLVRPDSPAVVILGHFSPQKQIEHGFAGPEFLHTVVAQYYDIPHISIKPLLYNNHLTSPESITNYFADPILLNNNGHELLSNVLISYFQSQICAGWFSATGAGFEVPQLPMGASKAPGDSKGLFGGVGLRKDPVLPEGQVPPKARAAAAKITDQEDPDLVAFRVPPARIAARPHDVADFREVKPFCVSANDLVNPLPPSLFYGSGWHSHHPPKGESFMEGGESAHYWYSTLPTSKLRVPVKIGSGDVAIYYWREEDEADDSGVRCWVDDNLPGATEINNRDGPPGPA